MSASPFNKLFPWLYGCIVLIDLVVLSLPGWESAREISKPMIVGSLMVFLLIRKYPLKTTRSRFLFLALLFSLLGDGFLNYDGYFLPGLLSFFVAHVFYILTFLKWEGLKTGFNYKYLTLLLCYALGVYFFISKDLGPMQPYVILYIAVLVFMVISVLTRKSYSPENAFRSGLAGALLFLLSDSLLAVNKFSVPIFLGSQAIMLTYALAQFMLLKSFLLDSNRQR